MLSNTQRGAFDGLFGDMLVRARAIEVSGDSEVGALFTDILRIQHLAITGELPGEMDRLAADTVPPRMSLMEARRILEDAGCVVVDPATTPARFAYEAPSLADTSREVAA